MNKITLALFSLCVWIQALWAETNVAEGLQLPYVYHSVNVISGEYCEVQTDLSTGGQNPLLLRRSYQSGDAANCWHFNLPNIATSHSEPIELIQLPGREIRYEYDQEHRLAGIKVEGSKTLQWMQLSYPNDDGSTCDVKTQDGQSLTYRFNDKALLEEVKSKGLPICAYRYQTHSAHQRPLIVRREKPEGRYLQIEYDASGRVAALYAPLGDDATPVTQTRFLYHEGWTEVFDALGNRVIYRYSPEHLLTEIQYDQTGCCYRVEKFFYAEGRLISRSLSDSKGSVQVCRVFAYDNASGQLKTETLFGNLSGLCEIPILLDANGRPIENGVEHYSKHYTYSDVPPYQLINQSEDNGIMTCYQYHPTSQQVSSKLIYHDGVLRVRHFYYYDEDGQLVKTTVDDGATTDVNDLTGVSMRRITSLVLRNQQPALGLPEAIEERYLDLSSQQEQLLKRINLKYSAEGKVIQREVLSSDGSLCESTQYCYDTLGRQIGETTADGTVKACVHDLNGNKIEAHCSDKRQESTQTHWTYDLSNRLVSAIETRPDGTVSATSSAYDFAGNKISSSDQFGNMTQYTYDALGRLLTTTLPSVLDMHDERVIPTETRVYDICDRVVQITNANGEATYTKYNARGKPIAILYPDYTQEIFVYNLDGTLKSATARNRTSAQYAYDYLARVVRTDSFDADGICYSTCSSRYNAFHLLESSDANGTVTSYSYDDAGRKIAMVVSAGEACKRTEYIYDQRGNLWQQKEWFGPGSTDYTWIVTERDEKGAVVEVRTMDAQGTVLKCETPHDAETSLPVSHQTTICNDRGQWVLQTSVTQDSGVTTLTTFDALNRVESVATKNSLGEIISECQLCYDGIGNKVSENHTVYHAGTAHHSFVIQWMYGPDKHLRAVIEAAGSPDQSITRYHYNQYGQLEQLIKPDGVTLTYLYDTIGRVAQMASSDGSICYLYRYNTSHQVIEVLDAFSQTVTQRTYDGLNQLISETLGNGLMMTYSYDGLGRRTQTTLPDGSSICYDFNAAYPTAVHRVQANGQQFTHRYATYDLDGKLTQSQLIGELGDLYYGYDAQKRVISIDSPYWSEKVDAREPGTDNITQLTVQDVVGEDVRHFAYDQQQQLIQEKGTISHAYANDSLNNRLSKDNVTYQMDERNQLMAIGSSSYQYDRNGCLSKKRSENDSVKYFYDALNRLIRVDTQEGSVQYTYDAFGRRLTKSISGEVFKYLYDGDQEIGAAIEDKIIELCVRGTTRNSAVAIELGNKIYAPIHDHQGSLCALVDPETHVVAECYRYSAFGEMQIFDGIGSHLEESALHNPWRFANKRYDTETGFVYFGKRFFDPETGRWITPDPLWHLDGPNRYAYGRNNPIQMQDLDGLFSFSNFWDSIFMAISSALSHMLSSLQNASYYLQKNFSYANYAKAEIEQVFTTIFGKTCLELSGYYEDYAQEGVYGNGEISDKVRITAINGVLNLREHCVDNVDALSATHGGNNVHYVFHPSEGWTWDFIKGVMAKLGFISPHAQLLADTWKRMIHEMGGTEGGGLIIHYAHSIGGTNTEIARSLLTPEEQKMIRVITVGSATVVPNTGFESVVNYVSCRDGVCIADPIGHIKSWLGYESNVVYIGTMFGFPFIDHMLSMETYRRLMEVLGKQFVEIYGTK